MQTSSHLFLIGFMGCGKTHWGQRLAHALALPFFDLDTLIERQAGASIADLFQTHGETGFRALEKEALRGLEHQAPAIVATGGGTPCFFDNLLWMNAKGTTLYLKAPALLLAERLRHEKQGRPLLSGLDENALLAFIEHKLAERAPFYEQAKIILVQEDAQTDLLPQLLSCLSQARSMT